MSTIFNREKRALNKKLKKERMERILKAAHRVFLRFPYFEVSMDSIRKIADVPQGRAEMYFGTREDLFLQVLVRASRSWTDDTEAALMASEGELEPSRVSEIITDSITEHADFFRLRALLPMVLEQRLEMTSIMEVTTGMTGHISRLAETISHRCPQIRVAAAHRLLMLLGAYASSLHEAAHESTAMNRLWNSSDSSGLQLDFSSELEILTDTLVGQAVS